MSSFNPKISARNEPAKSWTSEVCKIAPKGFVARGEMELGRARDLRFYIPPAAHSAPQDSNCPRKGF
jgi:hypothetical protein